MKRTTLAFWSLILLFAACSAPAADGDAGVRDVGPAPDLGVCAEGPGEVFEKRIQPLLENNRPNSCSKCHAPGVDLAAFVTGDACGSMQCLVSQELVDLEEPSESAILEFISRGYGAPEDSGLTNAMVREEYKGFLEWIEWASVCLESTCEPNAACPAPAPTPLNDAGYEGDTGPRFPELNLENYPCGEEHQVRAFLEHGYPPKARCGHCHSPSGAIAGIGDAPLWMSRNQSYAGARETIRNMYALRAINLDQPRKSRVLLKPLLPELGGIEHGGGSKFVSVEDPLYLSLLTWIRMQRECRISNYYPINDEFDDEKKY